MAEKSYLCPWTGQRNVLKSIDQHGVVETSAVSFHMCVCAQNIRDHENKQNEKGFRGIKQKVTMYINCKISHTKLMTWVSLLQSFLPIHFKCWVDNVSSW